MPIITVLPHQEYCPEGKTIEAVSGASICESLLENGIEIEHACDMACACTTCHIYIEKGAESLNPSDENEDDLLDRAWGLQVKSRLSCQAIVGKQDLTIAIPRYSINHAKERTFK